MLRIVIQLAIGIFLSIAFGQAFYETMRGTPTKKFPLFGTLLAIYFAVFRIIDMKSEKNHEATSSCQYEITVNEKSFQTSDFKTKTDGSIEFTADDGTVIRASEYEIRKLN